MSGFQVGDLCIIINNKLPMTRHLNGHECQIVGLGQSGCCAGLVPCYSDCHIAVDIGGVYCCDFACLLKKPGHDQIRSLVSWKSCVWQPPYLREKKREIA